MNWKTTCVVFQALVVIVSAENGDFSTLDHIQSSTDVNSQASAVEDLIQRFVHARASEFKVQIDPSIGTKYKDTFKLSTEDGSLYITGTSGVAASWGFYYYLSQFCGCHISWAGNQVTLPEDLPTIPKAGLLITSNDRFRYYQNVCTVSYSFAWWNWNRWEQEIDWMAMNGINLPLAFNAQEAVWQKVYLKLGFSQVELDRHFGGPAFLAWSRMGNIRGWGGPLSQSWHQQQLDLQHRILERMRSFGMTPVLPAFAGHVPNSITEHYPNVTVSILSPWPGGHPLNKNLTGTALLDVEDPMFPVIGKAFLAEYIREFGTDHVYNTDTFNEMTPKSSSPSYLASAGKAVYKAMLAGDPQAIWVMQGWLFTDTAFWHEPQAKALLTSVPLGHMIVLDLYAEVVSFYDKFQSYYGQPFIWCMLHDFGGTVAMYGAVDSVNTGPFRGRSYPNSTMVGIGLTPEGINQNDVIYEFMLENSWRKQPRDIAAWADNYATRRYGTANEDTSSAWKIFMHSIYNCTDGSKHHNKDIIVRKPSKHLSDPIWYDREEFFQGWDHMISAAKEFPNSQLFRYDLVDVTRQALQITAGGIYNSLMKAFNEKDLNKLRSSGQTLLNLLSDLEDLLATDIHFLLGVWVESAKALGTTSQERVLYEYNARTQVTTWGPRAEIVDYANKQWSGLFKSFHRPRWQLFITELENCLKEEVGFDQAKFDRDVFTKVEQPFTFSRDLYPVQPKGDQIRKSQEIHKKYRHQTLKWSKIQPASMLI